jgi:methionyl-tRNA formyltransferase
VTGGPPVRTVFLGSGGFGRASLRRLVAHPDIDLVGVVTAPARPAGRSKPMTNSSIHDTARDLGVATILTPERLRAPEWIEAILALEPELVVLADYGQIVPAGLLDLRFGALNLHPSLLPRHRGATPIPAAILAGDAETGVTLMRMDTGLDTGPVVAQQRVRLDGAETTPALEDALASVAADLLEARVGPWVRGEIAARPQGDGATMTRPLRREDGRLDPQLPAAALERQVRAYQPWPGSFVDTSGGRLVVWSADPEVEGGPATGTFDDRGLGVGRGERLALVEVQPAGGRRMPWDAFVRGRPAIVGSRVIAGP